MKEIFLAVRAIGAEFARSLWVSSFIGAGVISALLIALLTWLTSLNTWWWLLAIPFGIAISVATIILVVFRLLINYVRPGQNAQQIKLIKMFAYKMQSTSEIIGIPKSIMLFRVIRSIAAPKSEPYLQRLLETPELKKDFQEITKSFRDN